MKAKGVTVLAYCCQIAADCRYVIAKCRYITGELYITLSGASVPPLPFL